MDKLNNTHSHTRGEIDQEGTEAITAPKRRGRPKGQGGRKKGSKNKSTLLQEAIKGNWRRLASQNAKDVFKELAKQAKAGEPWAVKLFMDKLVPNAVDEKDIARGDLGITIVINDMKEEKEVIEDAVWQEKEEIEA